jgi:hypothetical protein
MQPQVVYDASTAAAQTKLPQLLWILCILCLNPDLLHHAMIALSPAMLNHRFSQFPALSPVQWPVNRPAPGNVALQSRHADRYTTLLHQQIHNRFSQFPTLLPVQWPVGHPADQCCFAMTHCKPFKPWTCCDNSP